MTSRTFITVKALHFKGKPDCTFPSGDCPGTLACPVVLGSLGLVRSHSSYAGFRYSSMSRRAFSSLDCCGWVTLLCRMQEVLREVCVSPRAFRQSLFSLLECCLGIFCHLITVFMQLTDVYSLVCLCFLSVEW
ncbi:unnamed protein product [Ixodes pacificus]